MKTKGDLFRKCNPIELILYTFIFSFFILEGASVRQHVLWIAWEMTNTNNSWKHEA